MKHPVLKGLHALSAIPFTLIDLLVSPTQKLYNIAIKTPCYNFEQLPSYKKINSPVAAINAIEKTLYVAVRLPKNLIVGFFFAATTALECIFMNLPRNICSAINGKKIITVYSKMNANYEFTVADLGLSAKLYSMQDIAKDIMSGTKHEVAHNMKSYSFNMQEDKVYFAENGMNAINNTTALTAIITDIANGKSNKTVIDGCDVSFYLDLIVESKNNAIRKENDSVLYRI